MKKGPIIGQGYTSEVFAWEDGQVCKLFYQEAPLRWVEQEENVVRQLNTMKVPVPNFLGSVEVDGRQGLIYQRIDGPTMQEVVVAKPWMLGKMGRLLAELQAELHRHKVPNLPLLKEFMEGRIQNSPALSIAQKEKILQRLHQLRDDDALCHFDFFPGQIIMASQGPTIIDWMQGRKGHPLADVARTVIILRYLAVAEFQNWFQYMLIQNVRKLFCTIYLRHYFSLCPETTHAELKKWMLPVAATVIEKVALTKNTRRSGKAFEREKKRLLTLIESLLSSLP